MKISDCCGVPAYSNGDSDTEDYGICPECKEHCEYVDDEEEEETENEHYQDHPDYLKAEAAKLDNYQKFQLEKYGNILPDTNHTADEDLLESGIEELNRLADWTELMAEFELQEK